MDQSLNAEEERLLKLFCDDLVEFVRSKGYPVAQRQLAAAQKEIFLGEHDGVRFLMTGHGFIRDDPRLFPTRRYLFERKQMLHVARAFRNENPIMLPSEKINKEILCIVDGAPR